MPKKRNLLVVAILTIVTLGIYSVYWLYTTRKEIVAINRQPQSIPGILILFIPYILLLVSFPIMMGIVAFRGGDTAPILFFLATMLFFVTATVVSIWWFYRYSEALGGITRESKEYYFVIWVACFFLGVIPVWMLIAQYHLNKLTAQPATADRPNTLPPEQTNYRPPDQPQ